MVDSETPASTTAATATAASTSTETKHPVTQPTRWGDIEDDAPEEPNPESSSTLELNLETKNINRFLDEPEDSNIKAVTSGETPYTSASTFEDLNLSPELLKGLYVEMKFQKPSKIQAITLPMILTHPYKDLIAQAHNGSGKTTCFVLGMLSRVDPYLKAPQALCICPTRELAIQNMEILQKMGKYTGIMSECAVPMDSRDYMPISKRDPVSAQIVVGTPGTIKKWMSAKKLGTSNVRILVFDEADHMLSEDGFKDDSLRIKKDIEKRSSHCQVLLSSATFNETVIKFILKIVKSYNRLFEKEEESSLKAVKFYKVNCADEQMKIQIIKERIFYLGENLRQRIIFVQSKRSASMLQKQLTADGYVVSNIYGATSLITKDRIISEFRTGLTQVLISNDSLARGFNQQQVNIVINYDLPIKNKAHEPDYEVYLHRVGRVGLFGSKGAVFNFVCGGRDAETMRKIELYTRTEMTEVKNNDKEFEIALRQAGLL